MLFRSRAALEPGARRGSRRTEGQGQRRRSEAVNRLPGHQLRSEEHTSELQSHRDLPSFPPRCSSDLVPLSSLAPGEYLVELKAKGSVGEAKQLIAFRVTS